MSTPHTTLNPGDLVMWVTDDEQTPMLVTEDGQRFQFQFARQAWDEMEFDFEHGEKGRGMTVAEAEAALGLGVYPLGFPGYVYKSYDEATGQSFPDPKLEESV
jgi:hypothetical protein